MEALVCTGSKLGIILSILGAYKLSAQIKGLCNSVSDKKEVSL